MADQRDVQVGQNLTKHRGAVSQQTLAGWMRERGWKWSQATTSAIEKGERPLKFVEAVDLAAVLDIRTEDLLAEPELATASRTVATSARQTAELAKRALTASLAFERERRALDDAIDTAVRVPGWDALADVEQIGQALTYTTRAIGDVAHEQVQLEREGRANTEIADLYQAILGVRERVWFSPDDWRAERGIRLREDPQEPANPNTPQEGTSDVLHKEETER
ncbi:hypothetical protein [Promicromonospora iranensis]|uniref:hypothetical protein n=1 Tax=Promicromonospora iranensis TaxID=1105144 RepID=UPI0023A92888|nr:hypothetical protein [Promicromonospora iranensis]